jgi:NhaP-type Na+/H+ or K+/H+ antiporter
MFDMENFSSYGFVIAASLIILVSYFFNVIARKKSIPSVLLLILLGILLDQLMVFLEFQEINLLPVLEVLGIIGLIMIVLEAALDLKISKEKSKTIYKSLSIAFISLIFTSVLVSLVIQYYIKAEFWHALLYGLPLSIMSSAIIIPSVANLSPDKKEFMIYEGTFSDIFGIMLFYFLLQGFEASSAREIGLFISGNIFITVLVSIAASYLLVLVIQNIKAEVKLFVLISILVILYSIGKLFHISSLFIILVFGLVLNNHTLFFRGRLKKYVNPIAINTLYTNLRLITLESSFVVRTFFFVIFGMSIMLTSLLSLKLLVLSLVILVIIYGIRFFTLRIILGKSIQPEIYTAPRGLITILLYYSIPPELVLPEFDPGILFYIIIISSLVMAISLISNGKNKKKIQDDEQDGDMEDLKRKMETNQGNLPN